MTHIGWRVKIRALLIKECQDDFVGLWWVNAEIEAERPDLRANDLPDVALEVIRSLLEEGSIVAGDPVAPGVFRPWQLSASDAVDRIRREWTALGREPAIGEIVWFVHKDSVELLDG